MPNIVNTFIGLFKDTTLVFVVGIFDFLRTIEAARADARWATPVTSADRLRLCRAVLFRLLLWHVALCQGRGSAARARRPALRDLGWPNVQTIAASRVQPGDVAIEITDLHKWYGEFHVLRDINLTVVRGERIVICGPSGSGKSTLLRCINRLEDWQRGRVVVDGIELSDDPKQHPRGAPRRRHGVPAVQPVSAPDRAGELHAGADLGAQDAEEGRRRAGDALPRAR